MFVLLFLTLGIFNPSPMYAAIRTEAIEHDEYEYNFAKQQSKAPSFHLSSLGYEENKSIDHHPIQGNQLRQLENHKKGLQDIPRCFYLALGKQCFTENHFAAERKWHEIQAHDKNHPRNKVTGHFRYGRCD